MASICDGSGAIHVVFDELGSQAGANIFKGKGWDSKLETLGNFDNHDIIDNDNPQRITMKTHESYKMIVSVYPLLNQEDTAFKFKFWAECLEKPPEPVVTKVRWW